MNICIDTREKGRKLRANLYYNDKGHNAEVTMLDVGDYLFDDRVVFEYKEIGDFMSSIVDGSLFNEAANQSLEYPFHYVVVVGDVRNYLNDNWYYVSNKWGNDYGKYLSSNLGRYYGALRRLRTFTTPIECHSEENAFQEMLLQSVKCLDGKSGCVCKTCRIARVHSSMFEFCDNGMLAQQFCLLVMGKPELDFFCFVNQRNHPLHIGL